jgi:hypothetical protein
VRAVPAVLAGEDPQRVLEEIVATLATGATWWAKGWKRSW